VDVEKFCTYFGIDRVARLPAARYVEALGKLRAKQQGNGTAGKAAARPGRGTPAQLPPAGAAG
jgi:hypothetical protein